VLVTGGTGGLGALVAGHLVDAYGTRELVLVGRRGPDAPGAAELRAALTARGAAVTVAACDVGDPAELEALLAGRRVAAVVHAAGVLADGVVEALTGAQVDAVLAAKTGAALRLDALLPDVPLVLFSSLAGTVGNAGQAAYAAANAGLDAVAERRHAAGRPVVSVAWGRWERASAMTAGLDGADTARLGDALTDAEGLALLDAALGRDEPVLAAVRTGPAAARGGRVPAVLRATAAATPAAPAGGTPLRERLAAADPDDRLPLLLALVRAEVGAVLGADPADLLAADAPFQDAGLDSLKVVELRNRLSDATGLRLPATVAFEQPNPRALAAHLLHRLTDPTPPTTPAAATATPAAAPPTPVAGPDDGLAERIGAADADELTEMLARLGVRLD
jgi:acyl carrier protein